MRTFRFRVLSALALTALATASTSLVSRANDTNDLFPGVWRVKATPDNAAQQSDKQEFSDEILFEEGKMTAAACASYGFGAAPYTVSSDGATFTTTMSTDGETIVWTATVSGGSLQGTVEWTKSDGQHFHYALSGSRGTANDTESSGSSSD